MRVAVPSLPQHDSKVTVGQSPPPDDGFTHRPPWQVVPVPLQ